LYIVYTDEVSTPLKVSAFRKQMGPRLDAVLHEHLPLPMQRGRELAVLVGAAEMNALLEDRRFNPEVFGGGADGVGLWLPELQLYGQGASYAEAKEDLLDEVREYVDEYMSDGRYVRAPNRAGHLPYVIRAYIADREGKLASVIFGAPPEPAGAAAAAPAVAPAGPTKPTWLYEILVNVAHMDVDEVLALSEEEAMAIYLRRIGAPRGGER
jgi:hypothetical protein